VSNEQNSGHRRQQHRVSFGGRYLDLAQQTTHYGRRQVLVRHGGNNNNKQEKVVVEATATACARVRVRGRATNGMNGPTCRARYKNNSSIQRSTQRRQSTERPTPYSQVTGVIVNYGIERKLLRLCFRFFGISSRLLVACAWRSSRSKSVRASEEHSLNASYSASSIKRWT